MNDNDDGQRTSTFAQSPAPRSEGATIGYVTVYPLTILLRVFVAQALVRLFARCACVSTSSTRRMF
ncbi:MAG: hypothetical protein OEW18_04090 [Candidatus Aminicenantes bacterium]|nr:hypothetical protein [Candidatus Aminicenantes bacterium]